MPRYVKILNPFYCVMCSRKIDPWLRLNTLTCSFSCKTKKCAVKRAGKLANPTFYKAYFKRIAQEIKVKEGVVGNLSGECAAVFNL